MPAQASLDNLKSGVNGHTFTTEEQKKGAKRTNTSRRDYTAELAEMQAVLMKIVTQPCFQYDNKGEILPVPAREIAAAARAFQVLEAQRRMNLGKANPAPVKSEPKRRSRSSSGPIEPAPKPVEPSQASTEP